MHERDLATHAACAGFSTPFLLENYSAGPNDTNHNRFDGPVTVGTRLFMYGDNNYMYCVDSLTAAACTGYPKATGLSGTYDLEPDGKGGGLAIILRPETGTLRVGSTEAPFSVADLPTGEDVELRIFVDKYLVEVFANGRQALLAAHLDWQGNRDLNGWTVGAKTRLSEVEIWKLNRSNQGFFNAQETRVWEPDTQ